MSERYLSIELGEAHSSFARTLVDMNDQTETQIRNTKTDYQNAIERATDALTGVNGGHIRWVMDSNNEPQEMLIMDTDSELTARVIWRYNVNGWGVSTDGGQTYTMAAVLDTSVGGNGCTISANYITAGTMSAARILGGILKLGGNNNGNGTFELYNSSGTKILTIDNTGIAYANNKFKVAANGNMSAQDASLTSATVTGSITSTSGSNTAGINNGEVYSNYSGQKALMNNANFVIHNIANDVDVFKVFADYNIGQLTIENSQGTITLYCGGSQYLSASDDFQISSQGDISLNASGSINLSAPDGVQFNGSYGRTGGFYDRDGNYITVEDGVIVGGI